MTERILMTGAAGGIGTLMRPRLRRPGRTLRMLDVKRVPEPATDEAIEIVEGSVTDLDTMIAACSGIDAVLHLGGHSREHTWEQTLSVNIDGTHTVLEAARRAGVGRVILASSNHAVGFRTVAEAGENGIPADAPPRPDTYYGVSKAAMEALGSLYHSRFGMHVLCVRIGSCFETVHDERGLSLWLSPDDCARLFEACLSCPQPGYRVVWGVSNNTRQLVSLTEGREIGYRPVDDAEQFADQVQRGTTHDYLGGSFTDSPLGEPN